MCSEFVKERTSVLQAAEIFCPEISSFLKLSVFCQRSSWSTCREIQCQLTEACKDVGACSVVIDGSADVSGTDYLALFCWSCQWYLNWPVTKGKTCSSEVLCEVADLLRKCGLTWTRTLGFFSDWALTVISHNKCCSRIVKDRFLENDFFLTSPLYYSRRSDVCKTFEGDSFDGWTIVRTMDFTGANELKLNHLECVALLVEI
jgi:hypothetical protein